MWRPRIPHDIKYSGVCVGEGGSGISVWTPGVSVWVGLGGGQAKSCLLRRWRADIGTVPHLGTGSPEGDCGNVLVDGFGD